MYTDGWNASAYLHQLAVGKQLAQWSTRIAIFSYETLSSWVLLIIRIGVARRLELVSVVYGLQSLVYEGSLRIKGYLLCVLI